MKYRDRVFVHFPGNPPAGSVDPVTREPHRDAPVTGARMQRLDVNCMDRCLVGNALDGMCVGLVLTDAAGRVLWMNRVAESILETTRPDCYGKPLPQLFRDPQLAEFWHRAGEAQGTLMGGVTIRLPRFADLRVNSTTCLDSAGRCIGRVMLFCDVTADGVAEVHLSREATDQLLRLVTPESSSEHSTAGLTPQELRILRMVGRGDGNQQIADALHVAPSTVRSHLKHVYRKTGLSSRAEAVSFAIRHGLS